MAHLIVTLFFCCFCSLLSAQIDNQYFIVENLKPKVQLQDDLQSDYIIRQLHRGNSIPTATISPNSRLDSTYLVGVEKAFRSSLPSDFFQRSVNYNRIKIKMAESPRVNEIIQLFVRNTQDTFQVYAQLTFRLLPVGGNLPSEIADLSLERDVVLTEEMQQLIRDKVKALNERTYRMPPPPPPSNEIRASIYNPGSVTAIDIKDIRRVPAYLFRFTNLKKLEISGTFDSFPDQFDRLKKLESLLIISQRKTSLPPSFAALDRLTSLTLYGPVALPSTVNKLKSLERITLGDYMIPLQSALGQVKTLKWMEVSHRNKGLTFGESDWPYIETLLFTKTDAPFPDLSHFSGLSKLFLTDTRMEGLSLKENINLKLLDMRNCPVDTIPELVYEIESLEQFTFRHTAITTFPVERLTAMKNLSHLDLSANYILKKEVVDRARPILDKHGITYRFSQ